MIRPAQERLFGVIGRPVAHSLSPVMMNRAFDALGIACRYLAMEITDPTHDIPLLGAVGFEGLSVTVPYKEEVLTVATQVEDDAVQIGAANTLKRTGSSWTAKNTDWIGVVQALRGTMQTTYPEMFSPMGEVLPHHSKRALVIGAGGAARAVCFALRSMGIHTTIANRTLEKAEALCERFHCDLMPLDHLSQADASWHLVIHTTSVGMEGSHNHTIVPPQILGPGVIAMDVVYTPHWTPFLTAAKERGCEIIHGSAMLLAQGVAQLEWWLGMRAPIETMQEALEEALKRRYGAL